VYANINQTLVNTLHGLLNFEIGGLEYHIITVYYNRVYNAYLLYTGTLIL